MSTRLTEFAGVMITFALIIGLRMFNDALLSELSLSNYISFFYVPAGAIVACAVVFGPIVWLGIFAAYLTLRFAADDLTFLTVLLSASTPAAVIVSLSVTDWLMKWLSSRFQSEKNVFLLFVFLTYPLLNTAFHTLIFMALNHAMLWERAPAMWVGDTLGAGLGIVAVILFNAPVLNSKRKLSDFLDETF